MLMYFIGLESNQNVGIKNGGFQNLIFDASNGPQKRMEKESEPLGIRIRQLESCVGNCAHFVYWGVPGPRKLPDGGPAVGDGGA